MSWCWYTNSAEQWLLCSDVSSWMCESFLLISFWYKLYFLNIDNHFSTNVMGWHYCNSKVCQRCYTSWDSFSLRSESLCRESFLQWPFFWIWGQTSMQQIFMERRHSSRWWPLGVDSCFHTLFSFTCFFDLMYLVYICCRSPIWYC